MSSCGMNNQDSDEEVDLEALRLAALKSRKNKYARVNHNNLIPIVPVPIQTPDFVERKVKIEKPSPPPESNIIKKEKVNDITKENDDKDSNYSESTIANDQDILSVEDKEEEDSLERLMDQLEAEISGKAPIPTNKLLSSKNSGNEKKSKRKSRRNKKDGTDVDDEIELVHIKTGREPGAIIEIRESASPERIPKDNNTKEYSPQKSPLRRSRSPLRSRSPYYKRSRSPYRSRSPRRSRSPFGRSRSPFWMSRRSRTSSRSPFKRYRSPNRKRSPYSRFSRSRSKSFERRRSPWPPSPRIRSKSPLYRDDSPFSRRRNFSPPSVWGRRSFSPRDYRDSPRRRSRSPRRFPRKSPFRNSKSPLRRSKSPLRWIKSPLRRSVSPFLSHSKSPVHQSNSPLRRTLGRRSKSPLRWSPSPGRKTKLSDRSPKNRSKSPFKKGDALRKPRRISKERRSLSFSKSPTPRKNRSPLQMVEKNKLATADKNENPKERCEKRHRSLSRENNRSFDRRHRSRPFRRYSPSKNRSAHRQIKRSKSPKQSKEQTETNKDETTNSASKENETSPNLAPPDPVLEARKKKFESLHVVDPSVDKKISLKSIKESAENVEEDEDSLTINLESNLWDESEESGDEFESRFKSGDAKKNRTGVINRTVLSFRNLRENDSKNRKILNKPLIEDNRRDKFNKFEKQDRWESRRKGRRETYVDSDKNRLRNNAKNDSQGDQARSEKRSGRKPIVWSNKNETKPVDVKDFKENEVSTTHSDSKSEKKRISENREKSEKDEGNKNESDDFDKLISDFEKELESDICFTTKISSTVASEQNEQKLLKNLIARDSLEPRGIDESIGNKPAPVRMVKISEANSNRTEIALEEAKKLTKNNEKTELNNFEKDGPEDYIEDDDFFLDTSLTVKQKNKVDDEDNQSDLRAVLSRRRNERLSKAVNLQENMPTRLVQSAFQGLGNNKSKRQEREVQESLEFPFENNAKNTGVEKRRVLLLQREKNLSVSQNKSTVPEVPDTTIYQRFPRSNERRKRKLQRQADSFEDIDQEEEEEGFEIVEEKEKQSRRFRLKRNVTLSSQESKFLTPERKYVPISNESHAVLPNNLLFLSVIYIGKISA